MVLYVESANSIHKYFQLRPFDTHKNSPCLSVVALNKKIEQGQKFNLKFMQSQGKSKGITIPLKVWTSPYGFTRLRLPDFKNIGT
jgi:hypothetical protein